MWHWLVIAAAMVCGVIPQFGVLAVPALVLASQRLLGMLPMRRNQLALLGMGLPTPLACVAPLWSTHVWWQRILLCGALLVAWSPLPAPLVWGVSLASAFVPLCMVPTRDATRWLMPVLVVLARLPWLPWWDVAVVVGALVIHGMGIWWRRPAVQWWSAALCCVGLASGAGIVVVPWLCLLYGLPAPRTRGLAVCAWWGIVHALLSAGLPWGMVVVALPLRDTLVQLTWQDMRRTAMVLLLWLAVPLNGTVARLQTSLGRYGDIAHDATWRFMDAANRMVGGLPWLVLVWCMVLAWAIRHLAHHDEAVDD